MDSGQTGSELEKRLKELQSVLRGFAIRATGNRDLAQDLVQDALLAALSAPERFAGRSSLRTWVVSILSHKIMDHFRHRASSLEDSQDSPDLLVAPASADLERAAIARQQLTVVESGLKQLPARERLAILMVDVEGVERPEVCDVLGISATNLRVLLHRGRNRLRRMLEHG